MKFGLYSLSCLAGYLLWVGVALAQPPGNCVVNILNRTSVVGADGRWRVENVPTLQGPVRARFTCTSKGVTQYGPTPFYLMNEFTRADMALGCAVERATWSGEPMTIDKGNKKEVSIQTRRALLALTAAVPAAVAAESEVILAPRIVKSTSTREGSADEIMSVALCKFTLPSISERMAYGLGKKRPQIGANMDTRCAALLVVKSSAASLSNRGRVMMAVLLPEEHEWPDYWACDVTWDSFLKRWLFGLATYSSDSLEISIFEITGEGVFAYPFPFEISYKSPWPEPPVAAAFLKKAVASIRGSVQKLSIAAARQGLTALVVHDTVGVLMSHYDWTSRKWGQSPVSSL